jgi:hypothetical protein
VLYRLWITDFFALSKCWQIVVWFHRGDIILKEFYRSRYRTFSFPEDDIISEVPGSPKKGTSI